MGSISEIREVLSNFKSLELSFLPTPVQRLNNLSRLTGKQIYCKRDDLTGFAFGGNKTRKLDFLMHDAVSIGSDCIVTFGSNQSNWCRMTSAAGAYLGMEVFMLFDGEESKVPTGNLVLDKLVGANIEYINNPDPEVITGLALSYAEKLRDGGRKPYYLPVGGSTPIGTLGYIKAFEEILRYSEETGIHFSKIYVATGSAGTQAGLVLGKLLSGWKGEIAGISVGREKTDQEEMVYNLVGESIEFLGLERTIPPGFVEVFDSYYGEGYRFNTEAAGEAIELFARNEGIFLDEVYTGKAASGLIDHASSNKITNNESVLFIHTGGGVQLFE